MIDVLMEAEKTREMMTPKFRRLCYERFVSAEDRLIACSSFGSRSEMVEAAKDYIVRSRMLSAALMIEIDPAMYVRLVSGDGGCREDTRERAVSSG